MINLSKNGDAVPLKPNVLIRATVSWPPATDYDLGAEVLYVGGRTVSIAAFPTVDDVARLATHDDKIRHLGDVKRSGAAVAQEILEIELTDDVLAVVPWAYSAQSNGGGSFRKYQVSMEVTDGTDTVRIDSAHASRNPAIYTCVPGMITNLPGEGPRVHHLEQYSLMGSERRPRVTWEKTGLLRKGGVTVHPNGGSTNRYK